MICMCTVALYGYVQLYITQPFITFMVLLNYNQELMTIEHLSWYLRIANYTARSHEVCKRQPIIIVASFLDAEHQTSITI